MKVGLYLPNQCYVDQDINTVLSNAIEQVQVARDSGFSSIWCGEHFLVSPMQFIQPYQLLSRLVPEAGDMTLGINLVVVPLKNPAQIAEEAATMDLLTGGRFVLCVGLGYREEEFKTFGVPMAERVSRFTESVEVLKRLFTEETVTHHGDHYTIDGIGLGLKPVQKPHPPIWIAGTVDAAVRRAARLGDAWMNLFTQTYEELAHQLDVFNRARADAGKDAPDEWPLMRECYIGSSDKTAIEECAGPLGGKYANYAVWGLGGLDADPSFNELAEKWFFVGDEASVKDKILRYKEGLGFNHLIVRASWTGLAQEKALNTIRSLGKIAADITE
jgi:alkanesulfonate monooxygenase SsuD/methylene tetrahydromethanopterin reductase-like flavin-dependent oxidoreductase (luciferase family)